MTLRSGRHFLATGNTVGRIVRPVRTGNPITRIVKLLVLVNSEPTFA